MRITKAIAAFGFVFGTGHYILWFSGSLSRPPGEIAVSLLLFALMGAVAALYVLSMED